jgi:hypothetical protein
MPKDASIPAAADLARNPSASRRVPVEASARVSASNLWAFIASPPHGQHTAPVGRRKT